MRQKANNYNYNISEVIQIINHNVIPLETTTSPQNIQKKNLKISQ